MSVVVPLYQACLLAEVTLPLCYSHPSLLLSLEVAENLALHDLNFMSVDFRSEYGAFISPSHQASHFSQKARVSLSSFFLVTMFKTPARRQYAVRCVASQSLLASTAIHYSPPTC
jgi:hypothetical protein